MKQGQINLDSKLGTIIYEMVKQDNIRDIVEVGTWNGMGSTYCIKKAIMDYNLDRNVYSFECSEVMFNEAVLNIGKLPKNFQIFHGKITDKIIDFYSIKNEELDPAYSRSEQALWWNQDRLNLMFCKNYCYILPRQIDLLILDGGEFTTYYEFLDHYEKSRYIVIDDINALKGKKL